MTLQMTVGTRALLLIQNTIGTAIALLRTLFGVINIWSAFCPGRRRKLYQTASVVGNFCGRCDLAIQWCNHHRAEVYAQSRSR